MLLVIFYMQQKNLLPTINSIQKGTKKIAIDGNNQNFIEKPLESFGMNRVEHFVELVPDLFKFFKDFDFENKVIKIFYGYATSKHPKDVEFPMSIRAPLKKTSIVSKYVTQTQVEQLQNICSEYY